MKRFLTLAISLATIVIALTGCEKNNFGKWETKVLRSWSPGITEERLDNIKACISEVEYFNTVQAYEGYRNDVTVNAMKDFGAALKQIDAEKLDRNLYYGEIITLTLVLSAPGSSEGEIIGQTRIIGENAPEEQ